MIGKLTISHTLTAYLMTHLNSLFKIPQILYMSAIMAIMAFLASNMKAYRGESRESWIIYREPGFLAVVWFGSSPFPPSPHFPQSPVSKLSLFPFLCVAGRAYWRERGGGEREAVIRRRESLVLYKSFYTLWDNLFGRLAVRRCGWGGGGVKLFGLTGSM